MAIPTPLHLVSEGGHTRIPNWLMRSDKITPAEKVLYGVLMSHVRGTSGVAFPGQDLLAAECGLSVSTVRRSLRALEQRGLVSTQTVSGPKGRRNYYYLHEGGSGQTDRMGPVTVTDEEEPLEEEPSIQDSLSLLA
jgi:DNA-binding MarR family transcriptional regulator